MSIVIGVDDKSKDGVPSLAAVLLRRLRFPRAQIDVVHALAPMIYDEWGVETGLSPVAFDSANRAMRDMAWTMVNRTMAMLRSTTPELSDDVDPALIHGVVRDCVSPVEGLLAQADQSHAELIAVDGLHSTPLGAFLTGSVARSLVIESHAHSLLLAKRPLETKRGERLPVPQGEPGDHRKDDDRSPADSGVRIVFATDHSPYANRCLHKLIHMAPRGVSHVTVMTAYPERELNDARAFLPDLSIRPASAVRQSLTALNNEVLQRLAPMLEANGATSESRVVGAPIQEAIKLAMVQTTGDLLVMGARGHGFLERLSPGSVSFDQAMTAPYSLLILRA